ncbi:hypothetical protein ABH931_002767 [Streptacidiphilus sp. MAP12-33]
MDNCAICATRSTTSHTSASATAPQEIRPVREGSEQQLVDLGLEPLLLQSPLQVCVCHRPDAELAALDSLFYELQRGFVGE